MKTVYFNRMSWQDADFENVKNYENGDIFISREEAEEDFNEKVREAKDTVAFGEGIEVAMLQADIEDADLEAGDYDDAIACADFTDKCECISYEYKSVEDALLVCWQWDRYIGYARELREIRYGYYGETEEMCVETEKVFRPQWSVLATAEELEGLTNQQKRDLAEKKLNESHWKWNMRSHISAALDVVFPEEEED